MLTLQSKPSVNFLDVPSRQCPEAYVRPEAVDEDGHRVVLIAAVETPMKGPRRWRPR
jgi:hypothetical protein